MEKLIKKVFVERVWYTRIKGNRQKMRDIILSDLLDQAVAKDVDVDVTSFNVEEIYHTDRQCEDRYELIGTINILEPETYE